MTVTDREVIQRLWEEQSDAAFPPDCAGSEVQGANLIRLDARTAGCVNRFLRGGFALRAEQITELHESLAALERVLPDLTGAGKVYFERLWRLASLVRRQCGAPSGR